MSTEPRAPMGVDHLTVVPENFEPSRDDDAEVEDGDDDGTDDARAGR